ncbi:hypothetical protein V8E53_013123, partial [Lactarius tabidus]
MTDSSGANTTPLQTELSSLRRLSEDAERDNDDLFPPAPDAEAVVEEADQNLSPSGSAGSQHTSSDKLSALPSNFQSPPVGRSATSLRMKGSALGGSGLPSTSETRLPPSISRSAQPVPHSVSDSAVERETPPRQRVSFDSDRGSSASPRPNHRQIPSSSEPIISGTHGTSLLARAHESVHGRLHDSPHKQQGHGHSPKVSQAQKNSAES